MSKMSKHELQPEKLLHNIGVDELYSILDTCSLHFHSSGLSNNENLKMIFARLDKVKDELHKALSYLPAKSQLTAFDKKRDEAGNSFLMMLQGYLHYPDEGIKSAAKQIERILNGHGKEVFRLSLAQEESALSTLFHNFDKPEAQQLMQQLPGLSKAYAILKQEAINYSEEHSRYITLKAEWHSLRKASVIKIDGLSVLNKELIHFLQSAIRWNADTYLQYAQTINEVIKKMNVKLRLRTNKNK